MDTRGRLSADDIRTMETPEYLAARRHAWRQAGLEALGRLEAAAQDWAASSQLEGVADDVGTVRTALEQL